MGFSIWKCHVEKKSRFYCYQSVPSVQISESKIPLVDLEIEGRILKAKLDLGFTGQFSATSKTLDAIIDKTFIGTNYSQGFNGKIKENKVYRLSKASIGDIRCTEFSLSESQMEFENDTILNPDENTVPEEVVRMGWGCFYLVNLYLDLGNSSAIMCDSVKTWELEGNSLEDFIKVPLRIHPELRILEIEIELNNQICHCMLDTGFSFNVLRKEEVQDLPVMTAYRDPNNITKLPLVAGNQDFGPITFHNIPIHIDEINAILGMDFFLEHQIYIDFPNKQVYISKSVNGNPSFQSTLKRYLRKAYSYLRILPTFR
jgi:hypothetical protein